MDAMKKRMAGGTLSLALGAAALMATPFAVRAAEQVGWPDPAHPSYHGDLVHPRSR